MNETYLAIDLGRSELLIGEVSAEGKILHSKRYEAGYINQGTALSIIKRLLEDYITTEGWINGKRPISMGLSLLGYVDNVRGTWLRINSKSNQPTPLAHDLFQVYGMPCYIGNNIRNITRAVKLWGNGKQSDNFTYINISTSIEAGFVVNGQLVCDNQSEPGAIGHIDTGLDIGVICNCGLNNCTESIAGGAGFDKSARLFSGTYSSNLYIPKDEKIKVDIKQVYFLSQQGDELCVKLVENAVSAISNLIITLVEVNRVNTIILGGDIVSNGFIYPKIIKKLNKDAGHSITKGILLSQFNSEYAGLIGAAAVAMNK
ncbi:putative NBD/HSP70 family sugar kinase [Dysgonomonas alginatilytica]|uniref:Putative NBD/HSP70 family sugar kinase n=1 Tax=Dysgonomonas alginatilytica TaxID=1605892 RepID=A0A2V3PK19_9BACT|nr:ROK family protein [Dysgonomonas alginatilytica]PXV58952.1 putative NBD/HSP70 family sugar kinase [Dysgonomonas alginatilytica]